VQNAIYGIKADVGLEDRSLPVEPIHKNKIILDSGEKRRLDIFFYSLIYPKSYFRLTILTSWSRVILEGPPVVQLLKNVPTFYGIRRFITVYVRALHRSVS
jgi:hypothetical protein